MANGMFTIFSELSRVFDFNVESGHEIKDDPRRPATWRRGLVPIRPRRSVPRGNWGRRGGGDFERLFEQRAFAFLLGRLRPLLHGLGVDGLVQAFDDTSRWYPRTLALAGAWKANSSGLIVGAELDVGVDQMDAAGIGSFDVAELALSAGRRGRWAGVGDHAGHLPRGRACKASRLPCRGRGRVARERRPGASRWAGTGCWSGPISPSRFRQPPRRMQTGFALPFPSSFWSNLIDLRRPTSSVSGPAKPRRVERLIADHGVEVGRIESLEDGLDAQLLVVAGSRESAGRSRGSPRRRPGASCRSSREVRSSVSLR